MYIAKTREAGTVGRIAWLGGLLCIAAGLSGCAPDEVIDPLNTAAALAEMSNSTLTIDPDSATISEAGDTVRLTAILSSSSNGDEPPTPVDAGWFVLDPEIVEVEGASTGRTLLLRGAQPGAARIVAVHDGLGVIARVWVDAGDTTRVPVAAAISDRQPVLLVGDTITIRPNLIDEDSIVIPTEPSEWSTDFDPEFLSVSEEFLLTALAPTPPGSTSVVRHTHTETDLAAEAGVVVLPDEDPGEWPDNEPPGMTPALTVDGSSKDWPGYSQSIDWQDDNRVTVVSDSESKHGQAIEKRFFAGEESGWHGFTFQPSFGGRAFQELYFRMVFRVSSNWQWHSGGSKFFYWGAAGRESPSGPTQFFVNAAGGGQIQFVDQSASGEPNSRGTFRANAPAITLDQYHTIEILHVGNTPGNSDGSLRMWIDGVEVESFNHLLAADQSNVKLENIRWLDYADTRLTGLQALMYWGGIGDTKRVNDWIRLSELYVSGRE